MASHDGEAKSESHAHPPHYYSHPSHDLRLKQVSDGISRVGGGGKDKVGSTAISRYLAPAPSQVGHTLDHGHADIAAYNKLLLKS